MRIRRPSRRTATTVIPRALPGRLSARLLPASQELSGRLTAKSTPGRPYSPPRLSGETDSLDSRARLAGSSRRPRVTM